MAEIYLKRFAVVFAVLLIFQQCNGLLRNSLLKHANGVRDNKITDHAVSRQKRIVGTILVAIGGISAGIDIYKQIRDCDGVEPHLKDRIKEVKVKQKNVKANANRINLAWVPAESKVGYAERLNSALIQLKESIAKFDSLQIDLLTLLDQEILTNLNRLKKQLQNDIDNNKEIGIENFEKLEAKFFTTTEFALSLTFKLVPVGFLVGGFVVKKIAARFARKAACEFTENNPGRIQKVIDKVAEAKGKVKSWTKAKINSMKNSLKVKWQSFKVRFPKVGAAINRIKSSRFSRFLSRNMGKIKKGVVFAAKGILIGLTVGLEIWSLVSFIKTCHEKMKKVNEAMESLKKGEKELEKEEGEVRKLQMSADKYYSFMRTQIESTEYLKYVREVADLYENVKDQTPVIIKATNEIKKYINEIRNAGLEETDKLNTMVISAFGKVNYKLDCLRSKLAIISDLIGNCAKGWGNFEELYKKSKALQTKLTDDCIQGHYMDKKEIHGIMVDAMKKKNKQSKCLRNNPTKKNIVCQKWYNDANENDILKQVSGLTLDDVTYLISVCPPASVSSKMKGQICMQKNQNVITLDKIRKELHKYNQNEVANAYDQCKLSGASIKDICNKKKDVQKVDYVQKIYIVFPKSVVEKAFNACKKEVNITPFDQKMICTLKNVGLPLNSKAFDNYRNKYDLSALKNAYDRC